MAGAAVVLVVGVSIAWWTSRQKAASGCVVAVDGSRYRVSRDQLANATTVADTARLLALPHHAVTVALAAALQESGLRNLPSGDRDSIGLFQQRPSQGWGNASQLRDTGYAAAAFLRALTRVSSWQLLSVNDAAQEVQHSATPQAYGRWAGEARALARALTGEVSGGVSCAS
jgi:hypothetical protein